MTICKGGKNLHNGESRSEPAWDATSERHNPGHIYEVKDMSGIKEAYTTQELMSVLGYSTVRSVLQRAKREGWQSRPRSGRGGGNEWLVSSMPESTRLAIAAKTAPLVPVQPIREKKITLPMRAVLSKGGRNRAEAKSALLLLCRMFTQAAGLPKTRGMETFSVRWSAGEIEAEKWLREAIPSVSRNTLLNWERAVNTEGTARLAGDYGKGRRGRGAIDSQPEVKEIVVGMLCAYPEAAAKSTLDKLRAENVKRAEQKLETFTLPSLRRLQAWMQNWKAQHPALFAFTDSPDRSRGSHLPSFGDFYAGIVRINQRWEYDGTPSDVMLSDGKRYTILGVIEIYTRRLKLRVTERSTAQQVAYITRDCILDWGIPEVIVTDNGKEFVSRQMGRLMTDLGIDVENLPPFRPDLKPAIERVFRTFSHDLFPVTACYVGHNVATRQKIRDRESFATQLMKREKGKKPEEIVIGMTPDELQTFCDNWTDKVYMHRPHGGLGGKTPYQVLSEWPHAVRRIRDEDRKGLDMLVIPVVCERTIKKNGVDALGCTFVAEIFGKEGVMGRRAEIRADKNDLRYAYIYLDDVFLCRAENIDGMAPERRQQIAVSARNAAKSIKRAATEIRKLAKKHNLDRVAQDIMDYHIKRAEEIEAANPLPTPTVIDHITFELAEAQRAASSEKPMQTLTPEQAEEARAEAVELIAENEFTVPQSAQARNALFEALQARTISGEALSADELNWISMYRTSAERAGFEAMSQLYAVNQ